MPTTVIPKSSAKHWKTDGLTIDIHAGEWAEEFAKALFDHIDSSIRSGQDPAGGGQKPLQPGSHRAKKAAQGRRPRARGFTEHGTFVKSLRLRKRKHGKKAATYEITTDMPEVFGEWLVEEKARGVDYFPAHGKIEKILEQVAKRLLERSAR